MTEMQKIIEQGFFYDYFGRKNHITCVTEECVVFKRWRRTWRFFAESLEVFEIHTDISNNYTAKKQEVKNESNNIDNLQ